MDESKALDAARRYNDFVGGRELASRHNINRRGILALRESALRSELELLNVDELNALITAAPFAVWHPARTILVEELGRARTAESVDTPEELHEEPTVTPEDVLDVVNTIRHNSDRASHLTNLEALERDLEIARVPLRNAKPGDDGFLSNAAYGIEQEIRRAACRLAELEELKLRTVRIVENALEIERLAEELSR